MKVYNRRATTNFSRYNATILSLGTLSTPKPVFISAPDLLSVYSTMFGAPASGGIRANAAAYQFLTYISSYLTYAETSPTTFTTAGTYLRNLLALPLFYFHANNLSPTTFPSPDKPLPGLPEQLYTTAALAEPAYRVVVGRPSLWAYIGGGSALLALCLCALVMGSLIGFAGNVPETGVWPTVDFVRNCRAGGNDNADGEENNELGGRLRTCWGLQGRDLRRSIADIRLFVREGST